MTLPNAFPIAHLGPGLFENGSRRKHVPSEISAVICLNDVCNAMVGTAHF